MANWIIEDRLNGNVVYAYGADQPDHFSTYPLEQFNHIRQKEAEAVPEDAERNISGVQYLRRFTQPERIAILAAATQSAVIDDYLKLLDATIAQGGIINLNDPDTVFAVNMLEQAGLIAAGRAAEVLV